MVTRVFWRVVHDGAWHPGRSQHYKWWHSMANAFMKVWKEGGVAKMETCSKLEERGKHLVHSK